MGHPHLLPRVAVGGVRNEGERMASNKQPAKVNITFTPWLPGHHAPQPIRRRWNGAAWEYIDDDVSNAAVEWSMNCGFDLEAFDNWLESDGMPVDLGHRLLQFRQRALDAQRAKNEDAIDGWVLLLRLFLQRSGEIQMLLPAANRDLEHRKVQARRRKGKPGTNEQKDEHGTDLNIKIRAHHARLKAGGRHDATSETASHFSVSRRTVQRALKSSAA